MVAALLVAGVCSQQPQVLPPRGWATQELANGIRFVRRNGVTLSAHATFSTSRKGALQGSHMAVAFQEAKAEAQFLNRHGTTFTLEVAQDRDVTLNVLISSTARDAYSRLHVELVPADAESVLKEISAVAGSWLAARQGTLVKSGFGYALVDSKGVGLGLVLYFHDPRYTGDGISVNGLVLTRIK